MNDTETIPVGTINYKIYYSGDATNDLDVQPIQRLIDGALSMLFFKNWNFSENSNIN